MRIAVKPVSADLSSVRTVALQAGALNGDAPARILIVPWGEVSNRQTTFVVDEEGLRLIVQAFNDHGADLPIDYEHQSLGGPYASPNGLAPAAGWIKKLIPITPAAAEADGGATSPGLWAEVEWTSQAAEQLRGRQYRYLSPVALVRHSDGRMVELHSAALTNKPAIAAMQPVVGGGPDTPEHDLRVLLRLDADADADRVAVAAADRIRSLQAHVDTRAAADRVQAAVAAGKLGPGQRDWALRLAGRDPVAFDDWLEHAPVLVVPGATRPPSPVSAGRPEEQVAVQARREFRDAGPWLAALCSEEAFVRDAVRSACGTGPTR